ncbi:MAG: gamma-glutamylcyclotransferase [Gammaproteobacteria bacterium]|nr:gamma-glutamylcyclotransferase [Gammaproteobacteria bacterium]MDH5802148.1 gamma-glutamylcyclotransferase [Gammaproteobacteria bacterium]
MNQLFVYGTLRRYFGGKVQTRLAQCSQFVGEATMQGLLYEIDGYPGAVESSEPAHCVFGELYALVQPSTLSWLDRYEECGCEFPYPQEYERKLIDIVMYTGEPQTAWAYIYQRKTGNLQRIESGDYVRFKCIR